MKLKINISDVFVDHKKSLNTPLDDIYFKYLPYLLALLCILIFGIPIDRLVSIFSTALSIFIGMFLNLLMLIVTFAKNVNSVKDAGNRNVLIKETFSNTSYTIVFSLISLLFLLLTSVKLNIETDFDYKVTNPYLIGLFNLADNDKIGINIIFCLAFSFFFYWSFSKVILSLLMIVKRIYKFFQVEISCISSDERKSNLESNSDEEQYSEK